MTRKMICILAVFFVVATLGCTAETEKITTEETKAKMIAKPVISHISPSEIYAQFGIDSYIVPGPRNITVATPGGTSNAIAFTVVSTAEPSIKLISPNGGEEWIIGSIEEIKWITTGHNSNISIQIRLQDEKYDPKNAEGEIMVVNTINTGSYNWSIPFAINPAFKGSSSAYKIAIYADYGSGPGKYGKSDDYFNLSRNAIQESEEIILDSTIDALNVPLYDQMEDNWCGPAAIQSILEYYNISKNQVEIAEELGFLNGTKKILFISEMNDYFLKYGFKIEWYTNQSDQQALETMEKYLKEEKPVIVLQRIYNFSEKGHYRIVIGKIKKSGKSRYLIVDFPGELLKEEFLELWKANEEVKEDNIIIVPIPRNNF